MNWPTFPVVIRTVERHIYFSSQCIDIYELEVKVFAFLHFSER